MNKPLVYVIVLSFIFVGLSGCSSKKRMKNQVLVAPSVVVQVDSVPAVTPQIEKPQTKVKEKEEELKVDLPQVPREFRAAWVASVANINWPSKNNLSTEEQKQEAISLLDFLKSNRFNAVIFQVRPAADALYKSEYEPWSVFLTGQQGKAPYPYYDPLEFWVEEAHKRGLELHVWLNPYRAHHSASGVVTEASMVKRMPESVLKLKQGYYWFDPSKKSTQDHASRVVLDIVKRYNIDGVHFDDYFYPYAEYNGGQDFPDTESWNAYVKSGGKLTRADWRRNSVNTFIERIYKEIKAEKNHVKFGISPFGIWKPGYPAGIQGSSQYDQLYADAKLWLNKGWIDYFAPQLYWPIEPAKQSFTTLLRWWQSENTLGRHVWPGINTVGRRSADYSNEIVRQIEVTRKEIPNSIGAIHWSIAGLTKNAAMTRAVADGPYRTEALAPRTPWLTSFYLSAPFVSGDTHKQSVFVKWSHPRKEQVSKWLVYTNYGGEWKYEIVVPSILSKEFAREENGKKLKMVIVKAIDPLENEGEMGVYRVK